jgi:hypothetical protein
VNGTSAAAAIVAGDAALLAQARPDLAAESLKGLLVGAAQPLAGDPVTAQGAGLVDVGGAAATEVTAFPTSLALGRATDAHWTTRQQVLLENVSVRRLRLALDVAVAREGAAAVQFTLRPKEFFLGAGRTINVHLTVRMMSAVNGETPVQGTIVVTPAAGNAIRIPWVITFGPRAPAALTAVHLTAHSLTPSDTKPALLSFLAGAVPRSDVGQDVRPLSRLDLELWSRTGGRIGLLARMRDVLPGRYSYGVTGRDPTGAILPSGDYMLKLLAFATDNGAPTRRTVAFRIK